MKKLLCVLTIFSFFCSTTVFAAVEQVCDEDDPALCTLIDNEQPRCPAVPDENDTNGDGESAVGDQQVPGVAICGDDELFPGQDFDKARIEEEKNKLARECKKKAKKYKRAVFKKLMRKLKIGQAVQVLFKKKKNIYSTSSESASVNLQANLSPEELQGLSQEQINEYIMNKINAEFPGIKEKSQELVNSDPHLSQAFANNETVDLAIGIERDGQTPCVVEAEEAPQKEQYNPGPCKYCEGVDLAESFQNDCSYMTGGGITEEKARDLVGARRNKRPSPNDSHCNQEIQDQGDTEELENFAVSLCDMAKDGTVPDFTIETSRNKYPDHTDDLAEKRGDFVQNYLFDQLKENCPLEDFPEWAEDKDKFAERVRVKFPEYVGNDPGDYGPDPLAAPAQQAQEISNLVATLNKEKEEIQKEKQEATERAERLTKQKSQIDEELAGTMSLYNEVKTKLEATTDVTEITALTDYLSTLGNNIRSMHSKQDELAQMIHDSNSMKDGANSRLEKYTETKIQEKAQKLRQYYSERDQPGFNKRQWDTELFNDFKMVRIKGMAKQEPSIPSVEDGLSPEVNVALNALVNLEQFSCQMQPIQTKRTKRKFRLGVALKKIGLGIALPVIGVVGGAVGLAMSPFATLVKASGGCRGCNDPGKTIPNFFINTAWQNISFKKNDIKRGWRGFVDGLDAYFDLAEGKRRRRGPNKRVRRYTHGFDEMNRLEGLDASEVQTSCMNINEGRIELENDSGANPAPQEDGSGSDVER